MISSSPPLSPAIAGMVPPTASASMGTSGGKSAQAVTAQQVAGPGQISADALKSLLQALGRPLSGQVTSPAPAGNPGLGAPTLNLSLSLPGAPAAAISAAGAPALSTSLPLPAGTAPPAVGTAALVSLQTSGGIEVRLSGPDPADKTSARADMAGQKAVDLSRQASLAPLVADLARLGGSPQAAVRGLDGAIARLMGFSLDASAEITPQGLKTAFEGARSAAQPAGPMPSALPGTGGMQGALGALIKALGLAIAGQSGASSGAATPGDGSVPSQPAPPPGNGDRPSRLPSQALPLNMPDLADRAQVMALKNKAEAALCRLNLLTSANQETGQPLARGDAGGNLRWDVPLPMGQEVAVLGLAVEADGRSQDTQDGGDRTWRLRFAFESSQHGALEGLVALHLSVGADVKPRLDIGIWSSDTKVRERLEASRGALNRSLGELGFQVDSLTVESGSAPARPADGAGLARSHSVDRRS